MLRRIFDEIDLIVGLALAVVVAVLGAVGIANQRVVSSVILALIALLITLFVRMRLALRRTNDVEQRQSALLSQLSEALEGQYNASRIFRLDYPDLTSYIESASEILVVAGGSLRTSVGAYLYQFQNALQRGVKVRLICPNPADRRLISQLAAVNMTSPADTAANIKSNLTLSIRLRSSAIHDDDLQVRVTSILPSTGIIYVAGSAKGSDHTLLVKLLPFGYSSGAAPVFILNSLRDNEIFKIIHGGAEAIWDAGTDMA